MPRSVPRHALVIKGPQAAREGLRQRERKSADYIPPTEAEVLDWFHGFTRSRKGRRAFRKQVKRMEGGA